MPYWQDYHTHLLHRYSASWILPPGWYVDFVHATMSLKRWPICIGCRSQDALSLHSASWSTSLSMAWHRHTSMTWYNLYPHFNDKSHSALPRPMTCSYLVLDCDSARAPSASPHRFYGTVYRPKLESLLCWRLLRRNWNLRFINISLTDCHFHIFICTLHFYLYVAGRLFAVSYYCLLLLLLLLILLKPFYLKRKRFICMYVLARYQLWETLLMLLIDQRVTILLFAIILGSPGFTVEFAFSCSRPVTSWDTSLPPCSAEGYHSAAW